MDSVIIRRVSNGWVVDSGGSTWVFQSLPEMLDWVELNAEGEEIPPWEEEEAETSDMLCVKPDDAHMAGIRRQRDQYEEAARLRYLNAFGTDAMTEAEIRAAGG